VIISHYSLRGLIPLFFFFFVVDPPASPSSFPLYCIFTGTLEGKGDSPIIDRVVATAIDYFFPIISSRVEVLFILFPSSPLLLFDGGKWGFQVLFCSGFYPSSQ